MSPAWLVVLWLGLVPLAIAIALALVALGWLVRERLAVAQRGAEQRARFERWAQSRGMTVRALGSKVAALGAPPSALYDPTTWPWLTVGVVGTRHRRRVLPFGDLEDALDDACERVVWLARNDLRAMRRARSPYR